MRVKTGETITAQLPVDILYRCSSCGKDNLTTATIKGSAHTGSVMGINIDRNLAGHAQDALRANLTTILDPNNPKRFRTAGLACSCAHCGHTEPWARMNYDHLEKPSTISLVAFIVSAVISFYGLIAIFGGNFSWSILFCFAALALSAAAYFGIRVYKNKNNEKMEQLITTLPNESLPIILPHSKERHDAFSSDSRN